jgi:hypothetical protein
MQERNGARELGLSIAALAVLVRFIDGVPFALAAVLVALVAAAGAGRILGEWRPWRWAPDRLIMPALAGFAAVGIAALIDPAPWIVVVFAGTWLLATWIVTLETAPFRPEDADEGGVAAVTAPDSGSATGPDGDAASPGAGAGAGAGTGAGAGAGAAAVPSGMAAVEHSVDPPPPPGSSTMADSQSAPVSRRRARKAVDPDQLTMSETADVEASIAAAAARARSKPAIDATPAAKSKPAAVEARKVVRPPRVHRAPHPRPLAVRTAALGLAFLAFAAIGGFVPGGLAGDGRSLTTGAFALTIGLDALVGGLIGARLAALRTWTGRSMIVTVAVYVAFAGVGGALLRAVGLPRLFGPALLTLLVYVVTGILESPRPIARNSRLLRETALLCLAGAVAIAWGLLAR